MTDVMTEEYGPPVPVQAPTMTIPAQPEMHMAGVTGLLQPTIMRCAMGGWMVVIPGKGVASKSELGEAISFLEEYAYEHFGETRAARDMPRMLESQDIEEVVGDLHENGEPKSFYRGGRMGVNSMIIAACALLGVAFGW